jgi:hypothetical protein
VNDKLFKKSTLFKLALFAVLLSALACGTVSNVVEELQEEATAVEAAPTEVPPTEVPPVKEEELPVYDLDDGYDTTIVQRIYLDTPVTATFESVFDAHNWLFEGTAGQVVRIAVEGNNLIDARSRLIDPLGYLLIEEDDTDGTDPIIIYTLPEDGLYTIRVDTYLSGDYTLTVTEASGGAVREDGESGAGDLEPIEVAESIDSSLPLYDLDDGYDTTLVQLIDINVPYTSTFQSVFDAHNWLFEGTAGQEIQVYATSIYEEVDTRARLISPSGDMLAEEDDTMGVDPWITITLPVNGLYTVRIDTWTEGAYGVIVFEGEIEADTTGGQSSSGGSTIEQWAVSAIASSQYGSSDWSASQATGEPDTPNCGDFRTAWASATSTGVDWIQLDYATPVYPTQIVIYETYNPGALTQISVVGESGTEYMVYVTSPEEKACPITRSFDITPTSEKVTSVILYIDQSEIGGWNEIDAVKLVGTN